MVYPISLHMTGRNCLIVGGGAVAARKARGLFDAGALITVISPALHPDFAGVTVEHIKDIYRAYYLDHYKPLLIFAATDDPEINQQVVMDAHKANVLVNAVDRTENDDFSNMITLQKGTLTVAISTGGATPVLGQALRDEIDVLVGDHYPTLADWLVELRPAVMDHIPSGTRRHDFWRTIMDSDVLSLLKAGQVETARSNLMNLYEAAMGESP